MKIRSGIVDPGTAMPIDEGVTGPIRYVATIDGERLSVVAKKMGAKQTEAECICAAILRHWGISVPEPVLLSHPDGSLLFGSIHTGYPDLKHRLAIVDGLTKQQLEPLILRAAHIVNTWEDAPKALAADEAIENGDRNLGNFLWDGENEHAYIDHERALGNEGFKSNQIAILSVLTGEYQKMQMSAATFAFSELRNSLDFPDPELGLDFQRGIDFVREKVQFLGAKVLARFPRPVDLFNQNDDT